MMQSGGTRGIPAPTRLPEQDARSAPHQSLLAVLKKVRGSVWLGKINTTRGLPTIWEWDGGIIGRGVDFVLPCYDAELDAMLAERYRREYRGVQVDELRVKAILQRIEALGGQVLCWN
jgi:hypothetical protein